MQSLIIIFVVLSLIAVSIGHSIWSDKKRREGLQKLAEQLGMEYSGQLALRDRELFAGFKLASLGRDRVVSNVLAADSGELRMVIFDYRYTIGSGKQKSTPRRTVVLAQSNELALPAFELSPESLFQKFANLFGYQDINFDDDAEFSKSFRLQGLDAEQIREFFTAKRRRELLSQRSVSLEGNRDHFIFYQARRQPSVEDFKSLMERAFAIFSVMHSEPASLS